MHPERGKRTGGKRFPERKWYFTCLAGQLQAAVPHPSFPSHEAVTPFAAQMKAKFSIADRLCIGVKIPLRKQKFLSASPPIVPANIFVRKPPSFLTPSFDKISLALGILIGAYLLLRPARRWPGLPSPAQYTTTTLPTFYNVKAGPVLFRVDASLRTDYVDNVNLSSGKNGSPIESDEIIAPTLGIDALWTITPLNTLHLHTTLGYTKYINNPRLDSSAVLVSPDSVLSFNIYTGDFKINLHEQFSYQEDPVGVGAVTNVEKFGRFTNDAGIGVLWDANDLIATLGYDHSDFIATGAVSSSGANVDTSSLSYDVDEVTASTFFQFMSNLGGGLEATASYVSYRLGSQPDATRASIGPFVEFQLSRYTKIAASGGYQGTFSSPAVAPQTKTGRTAAGISASSQNSFGPGDQLLRQYLDCQSLQPVHQQPAERGTRE